MVKKGTASVPPLHPALGAIIKDLLIEKVSHLSVGPWQPVELPINVELFKELKKLIFFHRFFIRTMDNKPIRVRAATIGRGERGDLVFVGMAVGTIVGVREDWVFAGRVVGIIV
jgi:hypothetical protein